MAKIKLSEELKLKIRQTTGLTYLADNLEKFEDTDSDVVNNILEYYAPQQNMLKEVRTIVKPLINKEVPSLNLPTEGGEDPEPEDPTVETVNFSIVSNPADATVTINGEVRNSITVNKGDTVTWKVEKEGYVAQDGSEEVTEETVKNIELVAEEQPEPEVAPTVTSTAPTSIETDTDVEYEVTTTAGSKAGTMVYGIAEIDITPEKLNSIQYWEPNEETPSWHDLPANEEGKYYFGVPSVGFPLADATSKFKINVKEAGNYTSTTKIISVETSEVLCQVTSTMEVVAKQTEASVETEESAPVAAKAASRSHKK